MFEKGKFNKIAPKVSRWPDISGTDTFGKLTFFGQKKNSGTNHIDDISSNVISGILNHCTRWGGGLFLKLMIKKSSLGLEKQINIS